jgi:hypothetical protein
MGAVKRVDGLGAKVPAFQVLHHVRQPGGDEVASVRRVLADEETESRHLLGLAGLEVGLSHGQLVQVSHEGDLVSVP